MLRLPTYIKPKLIFPIKGCFYYDAWLALENDWLDKNSTLELRLEPDNSHDLYAVQIWLRLDNEESDTDQKKPISKASHNAPKEMLIGYVPRIISRYITVRWRELNKRQIDIQPLIITHLAHHGRSIELDCNWPQINLDLIADEDELFTRAWVIGKLLWLYWTTKLRRWWRQKQSHYHHKPTSK